MWTVEHEKLKKVVPVVQVYIHTHTEGSCSRLFDTERIGRRSIVLSKCFLLSVQCAYDSKRSSQEFWNGI